MAEVTGVREAADTARELRDSIERFAAARESGDIGEQYIAKKSADAALDALVAAAERAETAERDWAMYVHEVEDERARAVAAEAKADTLAEVLRSIITDVDIAHDYPREVADARAALAAAEATDSTEETP